MYINVCTHTGAMRESNDSERAHARSRARTNESTSGRVRACVCNTLRTTKCVDTQKKFNSTYTRERYDARISENDRFLLLLMVGVCSWLMLSLGFVERARSSKRASARGVLSGSLSAEPQPAPPRDPVINWAGDGRRARDLRSVRAQPEGRVSGGGGAKYVSDGYF